MRLSQMLHLFQTQGKYHLMRVFYYAYIPLIILLGLRTVDLGMIIPALQKK